MTREDIIRMGAESKISLYSLGKEKEKFINYLQSFAALVASAEREACSKIAETPVGEYEVVVACGTEPAPSRIPQYANWQDIAKAIRARGQA
ncbi:hypothetical protein UFOVP307_43 [uncultured Caudovirales phage]|jgi:hypothetical protein|uniref:Uncharacterized protein n=1 Tax=uncultured Caudovirales phage TaxID=2100421 RepID=A0A6J5LUP0_9CAUD|nr:hypothetical protein UFOVP307_43 [uncultured Caudovirales phage]